MRVARLVQPLSRERIFDAAVAIADAEGIHAVTMRRLAADLGAHPTSLYHHCPSKEAILDGIVERMSAEIGFGTSFASWEDWVTETAAGLRRVSRSHPGAFLVLTRRPIVTPAAMATAEAALQAFTRAGLALQVAADTVSAVSLALLGLALNEAPPSAATPTMATSGELSSYPLLSAAAQHVPVANDGVWDVALAVLLAGLRDLVGYSPEEG